MIRSLKVERVVMLLRQRLSRQSQPERHPNADTLTAFSVHALSARERREVANHLAVCAECREIVFLAAAATPQPPPRDSSDWIPIWKIASLAAAASIVLVAVLYGPTVKLPALPVPPRPTITAASITDTRPLSTPAESTHRTQPKQFKNTLQVPNTLEPSRSTPGMQAEAKSALDSEVRASFKPSASAVMPRSPELAPADMLPPQVTPQAGTLPQFQFAPSKPQVRFAPLVPAFATSANLPSSRAKALWKLTESGGLLRSEDRGTTWQQLPLGGHTELLAVSAAQANVWVGGAAGRLFHSSDGGTHWVEVSVKDHSREVKDAIISLRSLDGLNVTLETQSHERWATSDGGAHWYPGSDSNKNVH